MYPVKSKIHAIQSQVHWIDIKISADMATLDSHIDASSSSLTLHFICDLLEYRSPGATMATTCKLYFSLRVYYI